MGGKRYYITRNQVTHGPYPAAELEQMLRSGTVGPADLVCPDGGTVWVAAWTEFPAAAPAMPEAAPLRAPALPVTEAMVQVARRRYLGAFSGCLYSALLAIGPALARFSSGGATMVENGHGRHSGMKMTAMLLMDWWPLAACAGGIGVWFFGRRIGPQKAESESLAAKWKAQQEDAPVRRRFPPRGR